MHQVLLAPTCHLQGCGSHNLAHTGGRDTGCRAEGIDNINTSNAPRYLHRSTSSKATADLLRDSQARCSPRMILPSSNMNKYWIPQIDIHKKVITQELQYCR